MRVKLTSGCWVDGVGYPAGAVLDLNKGTARGLIGMNRAEETQEKASTKAQIAELAERAAGRYETATAPDAETTNDE